MYLNINREKCVMLFHCKITICEHLDVMITRLFETFAHIVVCKLILTKKFPSKVEPFMAGDAQ